MNVEEDSDMVLARCHGFAVAADDRPLGVVETPVFRGRSLCPDYLIVRTVQPIASNFANVPIALVERVDVEGQRIFLNAPVSEILRLSLGRQLDQS